MTTTIGRYAPSPTGDLHLGNALAAVCAVGRARRAGGSCLLRIEDLDTPRVVAGATVRLVEDLARLGLTFDGAPLVQSADLSRYHAALTTLREAGLLYACRCSRKELERAASAPHAGEEGPPYPGTCRDLDLPLDDPALPVALRLRVPPGVVVVDEWLQGPLRQDVQAEVGDFIVRRKDGVIAYQLAVVVDDAFQGVTEVVRGRDLLSSAPRQALLFELLGHRPPAFAHIPLWVDESGHRLAKRSAGAPLTLRALWAAGETPGQVRARIASALTGAPGDGSEVSVAALFALLTDDVLGRTTVGPVNG